jgi:hypothetical protein
VTLEAKCRGVQRIVKIEIDIKRNEAGKVLSFSAYDPVLDRRFISCPDRPSDAERALKKLHSDIYHARGEYVYQKQKGLCFFCGVKMPVDQWEADHKDSRGAHGRDDSPSNLQICCTGFSGCDGHRRKHGG